MGLDFRNINTLWASILVETLFRLGLRTAVICPGSRSAPLAIAFASHPQIKSLSILDERSAGFFALGHACRTGRATALVCTSGTAGANFYPAIIEADESNIPLIAFTADRPPELRDCRAGQTIDQLKLFGRYPNWQAELSLPRLSQLTYLRQTVQFAWEQSQWPSPGPVHLNCPFCDPLAPIEDPHIQAQESEFNEALFFQAIRPLVISQATMHGSQLPLADWQTCDRGVIIAGPAHPQDPLAYCGAIAQLAEFLGWPVLAEGLSPLRNYESLNPYLISSYGIILKHQEQPEILAPEQVIQIGALPTSKELRQWLAQAQPLQWIIDPHAQNLNAIHGRSQPLRLSVEALVEHLTLDLRQPVSHKPEYLIQWLQLETYLQTKIRATFSTNQSMWEGHVAWLLGTTLPHDSLIFISNSMPVRDIEWFWPKGDSHIQPYFSRGTNGIEGTLSTAMGMAFGQRPSVLLTGDLAFLHDVNGLLASSGWRGHLTVIVINNNGGGIFEMLPIANFDPPFEEYFATPQQVDIAKLCEAYGVEHQAIADWATLAEMINPLPSAGVRVLEIQCDRKLDSQKRKEIFALLTS